MAETRKRRWPWLPLVGLVVLLLVGALFAFRPPEPIVVDTVRVERGIVREMVPSSAAGIVRPRRHVTVRAEIAGTISKIHAKEGDRVKAGAALISFSSKELEARVAQGRANVDAAKVAVAVARDRLAATERTTARAKKLQSQSVISVVELERADVELSAAKHGVDGARAGLAQAKAALRMAQVTLERAEVTAPFDGILHHVSAELGVQAAPALPLFEIIDDEEIHVEVPVDEADIARVFVDQDVLMRRGGRNDAVIRGKVVYVPPAAGQGDEATQLAASLKTAERAFYVHVRPAAATKLLIGTTLSAELIVSERDDVPYVPTHLVIGTGRERSVYVVAGGRAKKRAFAAGLTSWERTEVISGLAEGDTIVANLNERRLEDGVRVEPTKPASKRPRESLAQP